MDEAIKYFDIFNAEGEKVLEAIPSPIQVTGLAPNTTYKGWKFAYTGQDEQKELPEFTTKDVVPSAPKVSLEPTDSSFTYTITPGTNLGSEVISYKIYYTDGKKARNLEVTELTGEIKDLVNETEYAVQLTAINHLGESRKSNSLTVTPVAK